MADIKSILKKCMESVMQQQEPFPSEADFMAHLAMELKKEKLTVIVEYNTLNLYLNNDIEYKKIASQLKHQNTLPVTDIAIEHEDNIYPVELKYTFYKPNTTKLVFGTDATSNIKWFIEDIKKINNIDKVKKGYCIFLSNAKDFVNKRVQSLIHDYEWIEPKNPHDYVCLFKEIGNAPAPAAQIA
jgi:hypothetical protein